MTGYLSLVSQPYFTYIPVESHAIKLGHALSNGISAGIIEQIFLP